MMTARVCVGQGRAFESGNDPIKGVDGILGIIILLAYLAGGKNIFPETVNPKDYILLGNERGEVKISTTDDSLSKLLADCSVAINRHLKPLTLGSMKVYLSCLRAGRRPNGGVLPAVRSTYYKDGAIEIFARDFDVDVQDRVFGMDTVPGWIYALAAQHRYV